MSIVEELTFTREDCGPAPSTVIAMWLRPSKLIGNVVALSFCAFMGCLLSAVALSYLLRTARFPAFAIGSPAGQVRGRGRFTLLAVPPWPGWNHPHRRVPSGPARQAAQDQGCVRPGRR